MKHHQIKSTLAVGVALIAVSTTPAMGQTSPGNDGASVDGDIIVTAQRKEERLQDVPISITVLSQQQITNRNITTTTDLANYTPSLSVNQRYGPDKASFAIRGFNQDQYTSPTVGIYFADVVGVRAQGGTAGGNTVGPGAFMDLQNVQVLKGPQGTLFGRNTTGGAILLVPNRPTDRLEGSLEGTYGNYDQKRIEGVLNVPLADTFKVRLSFDRNERDGYMINHSGIGPKDFSNVNYTAARLSILADLTPDLENLTIANFSRSNTHGFAAHLVACDLTATGVEGITATSACDQIARQKARGDGLLDVEVNNPEAGIKQTQWQVINTTTWHASDTITIKNIASYGEYRERSSFSLYSDNFFFTPEAQTVSTSNVVGARYQYINLNSQDGYDGASESTATEELQIQGNTEKFNYVVGGYLEFSRPLGWQQQQIPVFLNCASVHAGLNCTNPTFFDVPGFGAFPIGSVLFSRTELSFNNHGIFAQGTYKFSDKFSFTAGARYTFDSIHAITAETTENPYIPGFNNKTCYDTFRLPNTPATGDPSVCNVHLNNSSRKPTWMTNLEYKPNSALMAYAKYARGYRQGGISAIGVGLESWQPEKVDTYEIGAKTSFHGAVSGYFNIAGFYNDFSNQQLTAGLIAKPGGSGSATVVNVGKSRIDGVEIDASATFFHSLRFDVGYTYLATKIVKLTIPALPPTSPYVDVTLSVKEGDPLPYSPRNRISLTGTYELPLDQSIGKVSIGATYVHTDRQGFGNVVPDSPAIIRYEPATDLLNLNLNWDTVAGSPFDLAVFATNVTNQIYGVATGGGWQQAGFGDLVIGQPRMFGVRVKYRFGQ